jgi:hypothetical protein
MPDPWGASAVLSWIVMIYVGITLVLFIFGEWSGGDRE